MKIAQRPLIQNFVVDAEISVHQPSLESSTPNFCPLIPNILASTTPPSFATTPLPRTANQDGWPPRNKQKQPRCRSKWCHQPADSGLGFVNPTTCATTLVMGGPAAERLGLFHELEHLVIWWGSCESVAATGCTYTLIQLNHQVIASFMRSEFVSVISWGARAAFIASTPAKPEPNGRNKKQKSPHLKSNIGTKYHSPPPSLPFCNSSSSGPC